MTKAIVFHSGDILWQPPAIYKETLFTDTHPTNIRAFKGILSTEWHIKVDPGKKRPRTKRSLVFETVFVYKKPRTKRSMLFLKVFFYKKPRNKRSLLFEPYFYL
jgi:hypothetical protein